MPNRAPSLLAGLVLAATPAAAQELPPRERYGILARAIDVDGDGALSAHEVRRAPMSLLSLDRDGDGNLGDDELSPGGEPDAATAGLRRARRSTPVLKALDKDGDGLLFEDEVTDAARSLRVLDADGDGRLAGDEIAFQFGAAGEPGRPGDRGAAGGRGAPLLPGELGPEDGAARIPDRAAFAALSYQGPDVLIDTHLAGIEYVKFHIEGADGDAPRLYFLNTRTHRSHNGFQSAIGLPPQAAGRMRGVLVYRPLLRAPSGGSGLFTFEFEPRSVFPFERIQAAFRMLVEHAPLLEGRLAFSPLPLARERWRAERHLYEAAGLPVFHEDQRLYADIGFLPLHVAESYGRLRVMTPGERPETREVVLYAELPNEMPRVAGVITSFRQTPLSHVNLRAVQDDVPNAFIAGALEDPRISGLVGRYVHYTVREDGYSIREATAAEVEAHFAALRPASPQVPPRDLGVRAIRPFAEIGFADAPSVGVKSANLAALRGLGLHRDLTPDGWAVPFAFYDAFMRQNGFYATASSMIGTPGFRESAEAREAALKDFRKAIRRGSVPGWMHDALSEAQGRFPPGTPIRCRSSTNNEDLPGFSGAGLYDSYTHHPDEGHLAKSIKQVFASLWNFRAFEEREFHRIDHFAAAMGVVLHPNSSGEQANGVGVTRDVLYQTGGQSRGILYYVNVQVGEDLVTNPEPGSLPEEILLSPRNPAADLLMRRSNRTPDGALILTPAQRTELRRALRAIHAGFGPLYGRESDDTFAMEVEFKVLADGRLFLKQARPWVD